jgi:ATP-dependent Lhr-like helicase
MAEQLLVRHGVVARDVTAVESIPGGFAAVYPVLQRLEETGRIRRGYFVAGLGAAQFAQPGAVDLLRAERDRPGDPQVATVAATDPATPYGTLAPWPEWPGDAAPRATRSAGARVVLVDGHAAAWIARGDRQLLANIPADEPDRSRIGRALALELVRLAHEAPDDRRGWLIAEINGQLATAHLAAMFLLEAGFVATSGGLQLRVPRRTASRAEPAPPGGGATDA